MAPKKQPTKLNNLKKSIVYYEISALIAIGLLLIACFNLGIIGQIIAYIIKLIIGQTFFYPLVIGAIIFLAFGIYQGQKHLELFSRSNIIGGILIIIASTTLDCAFSQPLVGMECLNHYFYEGGKALISFTHNGGLIGNVSYGLLSILFAKIGTIIFMILALMVSIILLFDLSLQTILKKIFQKKPEYKHVKKIKKEKKPKTISVASKKADKLITKTKPVKQEEIINFEDNVSTKISEDYHLPPMNLLKDVTKTGQRDKNEQWALQSAQTLENTFRQFGIETKVDNINIGPSVTRFELKIDEGVRVNRILGLQDNLKLALASKDLRIEAPIPGKSAIGIELSNQHHTLVTLKEVIGQEKSDDELLIGLGKDINGKPFSASLKDMPHLLIAGSTGSGKSVCINVIITSLLMKTNPKNVKLLLIDPKKVELNDYNGIPHLIAPVISDPKTANVALKKIVAEMEMRYDLLAQFNHRNIKSYNEFVEEFNLKVKDEALKLKAMPYYVIIIDELADLMMVAAKEVEDSIMRITQKARAAGIHLIVATQRPSVDVITGVIKANIPSRIAFSVSSQIDSRTILDMTGAQNLIGKGDMLFLPIGTSTPIRIQGAYLSDQEVNRVVNFVKDQKVEVELDNNLINLDAVEAIITERDEIYDEVKAFVLETDRASTSQLQRQFNLGYNRATRIIEQLEQDGVVGPNLGTKPRQVIRK